MPPPFGAVSLLVPPFFGSSMIVRAFYLGKKMCSLWPVEKGASDDSVSILSTIIALLGAAVPVLGDLSRLAWARPRFHF
jgi:hypothetical protein